MKIEERIRILEENQEKMSLEISQLRKSIEPLDFKKWWNSLDDNWKILFKYNIDNEITTENWWRWASDYDLIQIQPTPKFYEKSFNINFFSCKLKTKRIYSLIPLSNINSLIGLNCSESDVDDLEPISHIKSIKFLDIHYTSIDDIKPIMGLVNLEMLNYQHKFKEDKDDLTNFTKLKSLNIRYGKLTDISFLANLKELEYLNIGFTNVSSIRPLFDLQNLKEIYMPKTKVKESEINEFKELNPNCNLGLG